MHRNMWWFALGRVVLAVCLAVSSIACLPSRVAVVRAAQGGTVNSGTVSWFPLYGARIDVLAVDPTDSAVMYAANGGALYRTTDGALSWQRLASLTTGTAVTAIVVTPGTSDIVYVAAGGVLRSADRGATWTKVNSGLTGLSTSSAVETIALDPKKPSTLYAGTENGMFQTLDGGAHWSLLKSSVGMSTIFAIVVDPVAPSTIYVSTNGKGLCRTTDGGAHWTTLSKGPRQGTIAGIAVDPLKHTTLYAATSSDGIMKSLNSGTTWSAANGGLATKNMHAVAVDQRREGTVYALGADGNFFRSTDAGKSWKRTSGFPLQDARIIVPDPRSAGTLCVGTSGGVFRSVDGGTSWVRAVTGMTGIGVTAIAVDSAQPSVLYAATEGGLFRSTDGGLSWTSIANGLTGSGVATCAVDPFVHTTLYAGTDEGFFRSMDSGASWKKSSAGLQTPSVLCCVADPRHEGVLYVGTDAGPVLSGAIYRSSDRGTTWTKASDGLGTFRMAITSLVLDSGSGRLYAGGTGGLWCMPQDGDSWTRIGSDLSGTRVYAMTLDQGTGTLFVSKGSATMTPGGIYSSSDNGEHWTAHALAPAGEDPFLYDAMALCVTPGNPSTVCAETLVRGVFCSHDGGTTWANLAPELSDLSGRALCPDPSASGAVIIGTDGAGLFRYDPSGAPAGTMQLVIGATTLLAGKATIPLETAPVVLHDRTMLPIRALVEQAGGTAVWDAAAQKVIITWKGTTIVLTIGSGTAAVNGAATPVDADASVVPVIKNGHTLLPVRFIAESLGWTVLWNGATRMVTLQYPLT